MKVSVKQWRSPSLGEQAKVHVYGTSGTPVLFFNAACDETGADKEFLKSLEYQIDNGLNMVYTLQQPEYKTIFDATVAPKSRLIHYLHIEGFVIDELIPKMQKDSSNDYIMVAGVRDGAFLATNMMLKHPSLFKKCISVCGVYDMRPDFDGSVLEDFYYNNPIEYLPNLTDEYYLNDIRSTDIRLVSHNDDENLSQAELFSEFLHHKDIPHSLDLWGDDEPIGQAVFQKMIAKHIP
ncbi:MAG: hypothetical protein LAT84_00125 [Balneolia bacterium]|nr:hypothetical protein [Balneolia bacterium]